LGRIRYLAVLCAAPAALPGFYRRYFGTDEIGRSAEGDVTLSDGTFNLSLLCNRAGPREPPCIVQDRECGLLIGWIG
jgi:hypothetical protein